jgi:hypothetical protein
MKSQVVIFGAALILGAAISVNAGAQTVNDSVDAHLNAAKTAAGFDWRQQDQICDHHARPRRSRRWG